MNTYRAAVLAALAVVPASAQVIPLFDTWIAYDAGTQLTGRSPESIAIGDIDGDGDDDAILAKGDWNSSNFAVFCNAGDGTYSPRKTYSVTKASGEVILGDVDGDDDLDVVIADSGQYGEGTTISVYPNDGQGNFGARKSYACGAGPYGLALGDFDGDKDLDLAVTNYGFYGQGSSVTILTNDGHGVFSIAQILPIGVGPRKLVAVNLDGDDDLDLAVSQDAQSGSQTRVSVLLNNGQAHFSSTTYDATPNENWADNRWSCIDAGDMDHDGDTDLVFSSLATWDGFMGAFWLFKNAGDGTFAEKQYIPLGLPYDNGLVSIKLADLDGNGWLDMVGAKFSDVQNGAYQIILRDNAGGYPAAISYIAGQGVYDLALTDANDDSLPDVLCCNYYSNGLSVHFNQGDGNFPVATMSETDPLQGGMAAADIDADGDLDVGTTGGYGVDGTLTIMRNNGDGRFTGPEIYNAPHFPGSLEFADINGDQKPDMVWADANAPNGVPLDCHWRLNQGGGLFGSVQTVSMNMASISDVEMLDLNRDGTPDIVAADSLRGEVKVALNQGGNFSPGQPYSAPGGVSRIASGLFNDDPYPDIALSAPAPYGYGHTLDVLLNDQNSGFGPADIYTVDDGPGPIVAADLTGDGIPDLATVNNGFENDPTPSMSVLTGKGNGKFNPEVRYTNSNIYTSGQLIAADADHDGDTDLLALNYSANDVSFIPNDGTGKLLPHNRYGINTALTDMTYADFTGDGVADIAAMSSMATPIRTYVAVIAGVGSDQPCTPDIDGNGTLDLFDFLAFVNLFNAADPAADCTADGALDLFDFLCFTNGFNAGC